MSLMPRVVCLAGVAVDEALVDSDCVVLSIDEIHKDIIGKVHFLKAVRE